MEKINDIKTECNLNFLKRMIKEISLLEESAKEKEYLFKKEQLISASMCSASMATAYREVIKILQREIEL